MKRGEFISLILGLLLGLGAGVTYSWVINPLSYNETTPNSLREGYRQEYLRLTALSFTRSGDLERARERLSSFDGPDLPGELGRLAQTSLANDRPVMEARALAQLAAALANPSAAVSTAVTATPTPLPAATQTIFPTETPAPTPTSLAPTPGAPLELVSRQDLCDPNLPGPLIIIYVRDAEGAPIPGVEAVVLWDTGQDHFFTGLKPELGLDYGDFTMTPDTRYQLALVEGQYPITDIFAGNCMDEIGQHFPGSVELLFQQPAP